MNKLFSSVYNKFNKIVNSYAPIKRTTKSQSETEQLSKNPGSPPESRHQSELRVHFVSGDKVTEVRGKSLLDK